MLTRLQQQLILYTEKKVQNFFLHNPAPAHEFDHSERVRAWAVIIAKSEKANIFLSELSALVHDIGRTMEKKNPGVRHHELSYEMLQQWFRSDRAFDVLTRSEKLNILYSVRYHWNNAADKYLEAIVLRDADKIDALGKIGLRRSMEYRKSADLVMSDLRLRPDMFYWLQTKKARQIVARYKLMQPIDSFYLKLLKKQIKPISL